ncbi:MAG: RsmD family RNA methyltransferase [Chloroflexi bacterium]|nr:RsmD family RNA methyltransferase [Chloroflexota bacterium]
MRVIAGSARGRALSAPSSERTRPTGDKLKGAIFSMLEAEAFKRGFSPDLDDEGGERFAAALAWPRALDLYAGSGALGIEALSRGARSCDFVENNGEARETLLKNLGRTQLRPRAKIHPTSVEAAVASLHGPFDVVFADPPYAGQEAQPVLARIASSPLLSDRAILVWEHAASLEPPTALGRLRLLRTRRHGASAITLFAVNPTVDTTEASSEHAD